MTNIDIIFKKSNKSLNNWTSKTHKQTDR